MFIDENFNNSNNCLIKSLKTLIILRKEDLSIIQSNDHDVINSNLNKLNFTFILSSRDVIKNLKNFKNLKIYVMR